MKKLFFILTALLVGANIQAQFVINYGDTNTGYVIPNFNKETAVYCYPFRMENFRRGTYYHTEPIGTKIYGVACMLFDIIDTLNDCYVYFFRDDNGCSAIDSVKIDAVRSTTALHFDYTNRNTHSQRDTTLPLYEVFFDKGYEIDSFQYSICISTPYRPEEDELYRPLVYYREALYPSTALDFGSYTGYRDGSCSKSMEGILLTCAFPIIDSTVRIRHERILACGGIGAPKADYTAVRTFSLHWSDTNGHCLYQVAYGRANQPLSEYSVVETTDTCFTLAGLNYGDPWAFRVRAQCCFDDSMSVWRPWSDTVRFSRPYYSLILLANNPYWGTMSESGPHECGDTLMIAAFPAANCTFERWNDGDTANPRTITLVCDTMFTAFFEYHPDTSGGDTTAIMTCRDDGVTLAPNPTDGIVHITAEGALIDAAVYDLRGRKVKECKGTGSTMELDLKGLPSGIYTVTIHTARGTAVRKLALR